MPKQPKQEKPFNQTQFLDAVVDELGGEDEGWDRRTVKSCLEAIRDVSVKQMNMKGVNKVTIPMLAVRLEKKRKPATKAREGRNPATGETITIPAKKAHDVVKAYPAKKLKVAVLGE